MRIVSARGRSAEGRRRPLCGAPTPTKPHDGQPEAPNLVIGRDNATLQQGTTGEVHDMPNRSEHWNPEHRRISVEVKPCSVEGTPRPQQRC